MLVSANGELKISDFGCSRMADGKTAQQRLSGTPAFTAPELVSGAGSDPFAADVWAMGACLYCFIYGQLPFQARALRGAAPAGGGAPARRGRLRARGMQREGALPPRGCMGVIGGLWMRTVTGRQQPTCP
jgi:hypothetical protein